MTDAPTDEVIYDVEPSGVAWLVLNRPDAGNALTREQRRCIQDRLEEAGDDLGVRAIVLTATGDRHFCTGGDLRVAAQATAPQAAAPKPADAPDKPVGTVMRGLESSLGAQRFIAALQDCPKPIIAAVNGTAAGFGVHVALACDLVIAADTARFIEIFVRRGLIPDGGGAYLVTRLVGPQKAKELFFFGDDVTAEEAQRIGLVNRVVPAAELRERVREWAERLASGPTVSIALTKRLVNTALESERGAAFRAEALALEVSMQALDSNEGVRAFVERRPAEFLGW
jgi:2-(1,2-epoxy-1,2-dihydrophenyl)acetyl-CoA isomerase